MWNFHHQDHRVFACEIGLEENRRQALELVEKGTKVAFGSLVEW